MKRLLNFFLLVAAVFCAGAAANTSNTESGPRDSGAPYFAALPDTLSPLHEVIVYLHSDPEKSKSILDSYLVMDPKRRSRLYPDAVVGIVHSTYLFANSRFAESIEIGREVLDDHYIQQSDSLYMSLLDKMMEASRMINDFDNTMKYALTMLDVAKKAGDHSQMGRAYLFMGKTQYRTGDKQQSLRYFDLAEQNFRQGKDYHWLVNFYLTIANIFDEFEDYGKAHDYALLYEESLDRLAELYEHQNEMFIEIYKGRSYVILTEILFKLGRKAEAARYYNKFRESWNATDPEEGLFIVQYLLDAGQYAEAEPYVLRYEEHMRQRGDTVNDNMLNAKRFLHYIYYNQGDLEKGYEYLMQRVVITNNLRRSENRNSAIEIAAVYETAEREATIAAQAEKLRIRNIYTAAALTTAFLVCVILGVIIVFNRRLERKNRLLVARIQREQEQNKLNRENFALTSNPAAETSGGRQRTGTELFAQVEHLMRSEKLYLDSTLSRDGLVNMVGSNKNYLASAIQQNTGMNFTEYINHLRLEHSLALLSGTDELISSVASKSGFGSVSSFHRLFTDKYGISPNKYRKLSKKD